jgi:hypothetical protein
MAAIPPVDIPPMEEPPVDPLAMVHQALILCGVIEDIDRVRIIVFEGINSVVFMGNLTDEEIEKMAGRLAKRTPANTRVILGMGQIKRMKRLRTGCARCVVRESPLIWMQWTPLHLTPSPTKWL